MSAGDELGLAGKRILVVEDDALIAMLLQDMLIAHGATVVGSVDELDQAFRLVGEGGCDLVLLDVNLGGRPSFGLAARLREVGTPFVFATGYGRAGLPDEFRDVPVLAKPFRDHDLLRLMQEILGD